MLSLGDAKQLIATKIPTISYDEKLIVDHGTFWYFPMGWIGCCGVLVDKEDANIQVLGSGLPRDTWIAAHKLGFRFDLSRFVVTEIPDFEETVKLCESIGLRYPGVHYRPPDRYWEGERLRAHLRQLPAAFDDQRLWMAYSMIVEQAQRGLPLRFRVDEDKEDARWVPRRLALDVPSYRAVAETPEMLALLERALAARRTEVVVTHNLHWLACSAAEPERLRRNLLLPCRIAAVSAKPPQPSKGPPDPVEELLLLVRNGWVDVLCTDDPALAARVDCQVVSLKGLSRLLDSPP